MTIARKTEPFLLLLGDVVFFSIALVAALALRSLSLPSLDTFLTHLVPFSFLFGAWVVVFFIAGLYDQHTRFFRRRLPARILNAQALNVLGAALFFFLFPAFGIAPKTTLLIYLAVSFLLVVFWRVALFSRLTRRKREPALLLGPRAEVEELAREVNPNPRYRLEFRIVLPEDEVAGPGGREKLAAILRGTSLSAAVLDTKSDRMAALLPQLAELLGPAVELVDIHRIYEDIFERVPLSSLRYGAFLEESSSIPKVAYDVAKRLFDLAVGIFLGVLSLPLYPLVALAVKLDDGGPVFITQRRVGQGNRIVTLCKFRSMERSEEGVWVGETKNRVTRVGAFLRKTRIDELPQLWNIVRGDLSLIGPRPDIAGLAERLAREIPHYGIRTFVKPGLSGWAQIRQPVVPQSVAETRERFAYDLYYVKNRSFLLDLAIALRTIATVLSRSGA